MECFKSFPDFFELVQAKELESNDVIIDINDGYPEPIYLEEVFFVGAEGIDSAVVGYHCEHGTSTLMGSEIIIRLKDAVVVDDSGDWSVTIGECHSEGESQHGALRDTYYRLLASCLGEKDSARPSIPDVMPIIEQYVRAPGNDVGGNLALYLSNKNILRKNVTFCLEQSANADDTLGVLVCLLLLRMSATQRLRITHLWKGGCQKVDN